MTKDEIKRILDEMGVEYGKDAKLAELETLYASHATESQTHADKAETAAENDSPQAWDGSDDGEQSEEIGHDRAVVSAAHGLNMRDEQNGNVIHVLPRGAECDVLERDGEWCRVLYRAEGWVRSEFRVIGKKVCPEPNRNPCDKGRLHAGHSIAQQCPSAPPLHLFR